MRTLAIPPRIIAFFHDPLRMVRIAVFVLLAIGALRLLQFAYTTVYRGLLAPDPVDEQQVLQTQEKINRPLLEDVQRKDAAKRESPADTPESPF